MKREKKTFEIRKSEKGDYFVFCNNTKTKKSPYFPSKIEAEAEKLFLTSR